MAVVYRAVDKETQEWCAIKLLLPKYIDKPKIRSRFATEAEAMMRLRHRNVIHVSDVNNKALQPFFAMEMARGGCVVDWLAAHGAMPPKMAVDIAIQVCKGLGAAHRQGVVHRDVKPHNILVNRRGVCKITDFGIAQIEDDDAASLTRTGSVMGTLGYIAPEQRANAKGVDERCDVYSVGATLFTMVTGRTTMDLFFADQEPDMLEGVHEALKPVITMATRYRREERHQSMRELAKALYHIKADLPEDPPDTPSLVMTDAVELSEELNRVTTSEVTQDPFRTHATPSSDSIEHWSDPTPSSTPGIPRQTLLRDRDDPKGASGADLARQVRTVLLAISPVLVLVFLLAGVAVSGRNGVAHQQDTVQISAERFESVIAKEAELVDEMISLGADEATIRITWATVATGSEDEVFAAVPNMTQQLRSQLGQLEPNPNSPLIHHARTAKSRLERIDNAYMEWARSRRSLQEEQESFSAKVAQMTGLL